MTTERIIYTNLDGSVSVLIPTGEITIEEIMARDVPLDAINVRQVTTAELPADRLFRNAWDDSNPENFVGINLEKAKLCKIAEATNKCEEALRVITDKYSEAEMKTWGIQEEEARSSNPAPPFLNTLSLSSGIPVTDLKIKIITKADAFKNISAENVGKRKAMEAAAMAATTIDELTLVTF